MHATQARVEGGKKGETSHLLNHVNSLDDSQ